MGNQNEIIIGIISGILTSAILFVFAKFFQNTIIPTFRQYIYKGIDVSGEWFWENSLGASAQMEIKQAADHLTGIYTYVNPRFGAIKTYSVNGHIQDRFIQLSLKSNDRKRLGVLSYVFEVVGDGAQLKGWSSFYATNSHSIESEKESFFRDIAVAKRTAQEHSIEIEKFKSYINGFDNSDSNIENVNQNGLDQPGAEL